METRSEKQSIALDKPLFVQPADVDLNVLLRFVKPFDGSREQLNPFLNNCTNAYNLASDNQRPILFKFILSQLQGRAESACAIKEFANWEQLKQFLTTQFGERKCYAHLLTDLQETKQRAGESVAQYSLRIETCLSQLLTEITLSNVKKSELVGRTAAMEDLALHTFIMGLNPKFSNSVRLRNPKNLNEAINIAISEEKIVHFSTKATHSELKPYRSSEFTRHRNYNNNNNQIQVFRPSSGPNKPITCRYCKLQGHSIENCRKRQYNNNIRQHSTQQYRNDDHIHHIIDQPQSNDSTNDNINTLN